ncbi:MAG: patatin-like phospholipase family protein [Chloroflexi bacterium]|nr:patatin-like phospholipase family protein [Chloroflexota bacterium]
MKPFCKHVAIAIDGGGLRGVMVTRALEVVEHALGKKLGEVTELAAGTSTGSIIASGLALNLSAVDMTAMYREFAPRIFTKTLRSRLWPIFPYRYPNDAIKERLDRESQGKVMGDLWTGARKFDLVIVTRDMHTARTRFIKPWKPEYQSMPITTAVLASAAAPTFFPVIEGRYTDGGIGSFGNPAFIAAYEARFCLNWKPEETTLISIGTGRAAQPGLPLHAPDRLISFQWLQPILDTFLTDAGDQQSRVVKELFQGMDFRRFQITTEPISLDDVSKIEQLIEYGDKFGHMILNDQTDPELNEPIYRAVP